MCRWTDQSGTRKSFKYYHMPPLHSLRTEEIVAQEDAEASQHVQQAHTDFLSQAFHSRKSDDVHDIKDVSTTYVNINGASFSPAQWKKMPSTCLSTMQSAFFQHMRRCQEKALGHLLSGVDGQGAREHTTFEWKEPTHAMPNVFLSSEKHSASCTSKRTDHAALLTYALAIRTRGGAGDRDRDDDRTRKPTWNTERGVSWERAKRELRVYASGIFTSNQDSYHIWNVFTGTDMHGDAAGAPPLVGGHGQAGAQRTARAGMHGVR